MRDPWPYSLEGQPSGQGTARETKAPRYHTRSIFFKKKAPTKKKNLLRSGHRATTGALVLIRGGGGGGGWGFLRFNRHFLVLEKPFSDVYVMGGAGGRQKKFSRQRGRVREFWPTFRNWGGSRQGFHPFWVRCSGFQPRNPLRLWNWGKSRPKMDSAPSK